MTTKSTSGTLQQKVLQSIGFEKLYTCMLTHKADTVTSLVLLNEIVQALRYVTYVYYVEPGCRRNSFERLHSKCLSSRLVTT